MNANDFMFFMFGFCVGRFIQYLADRHDAPIKP